jgi:hypothetical protein
MVGASQRHLLNQLDTADHGMYHGSGDKLNSCTGVRPPESCDGASCGVSPLIVTLVLTPARATVILCEHGQAIP